MTLEKEPITLEELKKILSERIESLLRYEQDLFYHTYFFLKKKALRSWVKRFSFRILATCLILNAYKIPITVETVHFFNEERKTESIRDTLKTLSDYRILLPIEKLEVKKKRRSSRGLEKREWNWTFYARQYEINPLFLRMLKLPIKMQE